MKHLKLILTMMMVCVLATACGGSKNAIVTINDTVITQKEFDAEIEKVAKNPELKAQGVEIKKDDANPLYLVIKSRVIDEMIVRALIEEEIAKRKITVSDKELAAENKKIIDSIGSSDKYKELLAQSGVSEKEFLSDLKNQLRYMKLIDQLSPTTVTDGDIEKFYKSNPNEFKYPDKVRASHILISANQEEMKALYRSEKDTRYKSEDELNAKLKQDLAAKHKLAQEVLAEVKKNPKNFEKIAREKSEDIASAKQGGDLGEFAYNEKVEAFSKAAFAMKPNTISELVETPYGYHIIIVKDRIKAGTMPLSKVKNEIRNYLTMQKKGEVISKFIEGIKKTAKITYNDSSYNPDNIQKQIKELTSLPAPNGMPAKKK